MARDNHDDGIDRRHVLECMLWAGTGVLRTDSGGVPKSFGLLSEAGGGNCREFIHVLADLRQPCRLRQESQSQCARYSARSDREGSKRFPSSPAFMLHTGDITHLSKPKEFDDAAQVIGSVGLDVHYVPGEHDNLDEVPLKSYLERYGKNALRAPAGIPSIRMASISSASTM